MIARQFKCIFQQSSLIYAHQQLIATNGTHIFLQMSRWHAIRFVILQNGAQKLEFTNKSVRAHGNGNVGLPQCSLPFCRCKFLTNPGPAHRTTVHSTATPNRHPSKFVADD